METLYVDNYKGFVDTFISIQNVNFFVGENSTGKTAILNLLSIITSNNFFNTLSFNTDDMVLGYFDEMVNQKSETKTYFTIGFEYEIPNRNIKSKFLLMKFTNKDNIPFLSEFMFVEGDCTILAIINEEAFTYKKEEYKKEDFKTWINNYPSLTLKEGRTLSADKRLATNSILDFKINYILRTIEEVENNRRINELWRIRFSFMLGEEMTIYSPIRAKGKRIYEGFQQSFSPEGTHTPVLLRKIYSNKKIPREKHILDSLIKFGKDSALFDEIKVYEFVDSEKGPFELDVVYDELSIKISNVGFGVSQVLPFIVDIANSDKKRFCIQQPEVHLHPKAQAAFGEFVYDSALKSNNSFLIETHSDYMIDRFRYKMHLSEGNKKTINAQVLFFERTPQGLKVTPLKFRESGQYPENLPKAYSKFFIDEELNKLEI